MSCLHCTIRDDVAESVQENGLDTTAGFLMQTAAEVVASMPKEEQLMTVNRLYDHFLMCFLDAVGGESHPSRKQGATH